jgi:hypothetical protein
MAKTRPCFFLMLCGLPLSSCNCNREELFETPDASVPDAAVPADAGPPPPEFTLKPGDRLKYPPPMTVTWCNESIDAACTEQSATWQSEYTIQDPGASLDPDTNSWLVPAQYFWQVAEQKKDDEAAYQGLSKLWLSAFGPWQNATGASATETLSFRTTAPLLQNGEADTFPFFDLTARFDAAAQTFETYVTGLDADARVESQEAARKLEAGYLEPSDQSLLHFVSIIYHSLGFVCQVQEAIGPWDPAKPKNAQGFRNNQQDYKSNVNAPRLIRATGEHAGEVQYCKCGTQAGTDCE